MPLGRKCFEWKTESNVYFAYWITDISINASIYSIKKVTLSTVSPKKKVFIWQIITKMHDHGVTLFRVNTSSSICFQVSRPLRSAPSCSAVWAMETGTRFTFITTTRWVYRWSCSLKNSTVFIPHLWYLMLSDCTYISVSVHSFVLLKCWQESCSCWLSTLLRDCMFLRELIFLCGCLPVPIIFMHIRCTSPLIFFTFCFIFFSQLHDMWVWMCVMMRIKIPLPKRLLCAFLPLFTNKKTQMEQ